MTGADPGESASDVWPASLYYHQRSALLHNIIPRIHDAGATSLLDIGAGYPAMAVPLSQHVRAYCAIEQDNECAAALRDVGLQVIEGIFPLPIHRTYDFVLSCHSVPEGSTALYPPFLNAAWESVSQNGLLLIVTFKGSHGALGYLDQKLLGRTDTDNAQFDTLIECCNRLGMVEVYPVNSFVEATFANAIVEFLGPWLTSSQHTRDAFKSRLLRIVEREYRVRDNLYVFPTQHLFIECKR